MTTHALKQAKSSPSSHCLLRRPKACASENVSENQNSKSKDATPRAHPFLLNFWKKKKHILLHKTLISNPLTQKGMKKSHLHVTAPLS
jgi:hypothetical protein